MSLPDALRIGPQASVDNMKIKTTTLEAILNNSQECVIQLPSEGVLDQGSTLILAVEGTNCFLPLQCGVRSLIKRVEMTIGGRTVASTDHFAHYSAMRRLADMTPEERAMKDFVRTGATGDRFGNVDPGTAPSVAFRDLDYANNASATVPGSIKPTTNPSDTPLFSLKLSELLQFAKSRQIPLGMIKQPVFIRILWAQQTAAPTDNGIVACGTQGQNIAAAPSLVNTLFCADTLFYSPPIMAELERRVNSDKGLVYTYEDVSVTVNEIAAASFTAGQTQTISREILLSGKTVRSLFNVDTKNRTNNHSLMGAYTSDGGLMDNTIQWSINDRLVYDKPIDSVPKRQAQVKLALGAPIQLPSQLISYDADSPKDGSAAPAQSSIFAGTIEGFNVSTAPLNEIDYRATRQYDALDLTTTAQNVPGAGRLIGSKPIRLRKSYYTTTNQDLQRTWRTFAIYERTMAIRNGVVEVD